MFMPRNGSGRLRAGQVFLAGFCPYIIYLGKGPAKVEICLLLHYPNFMSAACISGVFEAKLR